MLGVWLLWHKAQSKIALAPAMSGRPSATASKLRGPNPRASLLNADSTLNPHLEP